jgi:adenosylcobinamide kinase/adenosylcobinamide-phosphate guanylyltransferase
MMHKNNLVIGGCRSGKSSHALMIAESYAKKRLYIATCVPQDEEMRERVKNHRAERDDSWECIEEPFNIAEIIHQHHEAYGVILIDCITLWISNYILQANEDKTPFIPVDAFIEAANSASCPVIIVTNEVGAGIVPENKLARKYRDLAGMINQKIASGISNVTWMVAGIPVKIK